MWGNLLEVTIHTWCVLKRSRQWSENIVSCFCAALKSCNCSKEPSLKDSHFTHKQYLAWNSISVRKSTWSYDTFVVCPKTKSSMKREYRESLLCSSEVSRDRSTGPSLKGREGDEYWVPSRRVAFAIAVDRLPSEAEKFNPEVLVSLCVVRMTMYDHLMYVQQDVHCVIWGRVLRSRLQQHLHSLNERDQLACL